MSRKQMEVAIGNLIENQEFLEASMKPLAELMFSKLKAYMDAGFTRAEALDLLKARGLSA